MLLAFFGSFKYAELIHNSNISCRVISLACDKSASFFCSSGVKVAITVFFRLVFCVFPRCFEIPLRICIFYLFTKVNNSFIKQSIGSTPYIKCCIDCQINLMWVIHYGCNVFTNHVSFIKIMPCPQTIIFLLG